MLLQQEHDEQAIRLRSALREIEDLQEQVDNLQQGLSLSISGCMHALICVSFSSTQ